MSTAANIPAHSTARAFAAAKAENRAALVGFLPASFPDLETSIQACRIMVENGCDVIEIGLPYSDPVLDGPVIQAASQAALDGGFRVADIFRAVEGVAATGAPTVIMTAWNPVERYGVDRFATDLANAGGGGLITPDITPDYAPEWIAAADERDLDKIFLVAPSSTDDRIAMTTANSRGFVYAAAVMGVTGVQQASADVAGPLVARTKALAPEGLAVGVGIGVSNGRQAAEIGAFADGVIVGTAFVRTLLAGDRAQAFRDLAALTSDLAEGVRR